VSFAWTVVLSVMRGALDEGSAPTTQQLADAVDAVAAAAAAAAPAAAALAEAPSSGGAAAAAAANGGGASGVTNVVAARAGSVGASMPGLGLKSLVASPQEGQR
jgi:hypothetical protein